jgi:WD40 repeat protein
MVDYGYTDSFALSPDGKLLVSGCRETVKVWDVATGTLTRTLTGHTAWIYSVAFSPDGRLPASLEVPTRR